MKISLCIVAYNEESFLPNLFNDLKAQTYPHEKTEIILVNSASTDKTKEIMEQFAAEDHGFRSVLILDNPKKVQACGWNIAISAASGDVIFRIDGHTHIPSEFAQLNVDNIKSGEYVSGGIRSCLIENENAWTKTLLQVENSLFGSSVNKCRRGGEKTYVKTMFHAAYRREVFAKAGGFNENLLRTEDNEMHYRIREAGYKLSFDPAILSYQYARSNLRKMIRQKYGNGKWIGLTLGVCPGCISVFHLIPFCFLGGIVLTSVLAALGWWQLGALMWALYGLFALVNTVISIVQDGFLLPKLLMPFLFLILHVSYGVGTLVGLVKMPFSAKKLRNCKEIEDTGRRVMQNSTPTLPSEFQSN